MKEIILKNYKIGLFILAVIYIIGLLFFFQIEKNKEIANLQKEILQKSDEEKLIELIKSEKNKIIDYKNSIKVLELNLQESNKKNSCLKSQLDRLVEGLEYGLDYCKGNNLDKFQGLE